MAITVAAYVLLIEISLWRGQIAIETRQHQKALRWLLAADFVSLDKAELHFLLARCYRRLGQYEKVPAHLDRALALGWATRPLEREQWLLLAQTGQYEAMASHWPQLLTDAGSDGPEISKAFVTGCLGMLRLGDAARMLDAWEKDFPQDPDPHALRGQLYEVLLRWTDSAKSYQRALELAPERVDVQFGLAKALMKQSKLDQAEVHLRAVLRQQPEHHEAKLLLVQNLIKTERSETALELVNDILVQQPDNSDVLLERGRIELGGSDPKSAMVYLKKANELRPEDRQIAYHYAKALQAAGHGEEAQKYFAFVDEATKPLLRMNAMVERLLEDTDNIALRLEVANTIGTYRSREIAATWYQSILKMDPACLEAHQALADYYQATGRTDRSEFHRTAATALQGYELAPTSSTDLQDKPPIDDSVPQ